MDVLTCRIAEYAKKIWYDINLQTLAEYMNNNGDKAGMREAIATKWNQGRSCVAARRASLLRGFYRLS